MRLTGFPPGLAACAAAILISASSPAWAVEGELARMQDKLDSLFRKVTPSIVGVQPYTPEQRLRFSMGLPRKPEEGAGKAEKNEYFRKLEEVFHRINAVGSGFILDREGYVVTSIRAVPPGARKVTVIFHDGKSESAQVVGRAKAYDVALLKVARKDIEPASLGGEVRLGQQVISAGNVFDITYRMRRFAFSLGTVTGSYEVKAGAGYTTYYEGPIIETDAAVNPGIFGGPLFDLRGRIAGMITSTFSFQRFLGSAVPIERVMKGVQEIRNPAAGLVGERIALTDAGAEVVWSGDDLKIASVEKGGPAEQAGLKPGDSVIMIQEEKPTKENLADLISRAAGAGAFSLRIERDGWEKNFDLEVREPSDEGDQGDDF